MITAPGHEIEDFMSVQKNNPTDRVMSLVLGASSKNIISG